MKVSAVSSLKNQHRLRSAQLSSAFAHAANYHHDDWGYVDVHRRYPGITIPAEAAFDALWTSSELTSIAQWPCPVPSVLDQALVLALHTARGEGRTKSQTDLDVAFTSQPAAFQDAVRSRAASLGAELALAAALGELGRVAARLHASDEFFAEGVNGAATPVQTLTTLCEYVAMELGHEPTRSEMRAAFWQRIRNGLGFKRRSVHLRIPE